MQVTALHVAEILTESLTATWEENAVLEGMTKALAVDQVDRCNEAATYTAHSCKWQIKIPFQGLC